MTAMHHDHTGTRPQGSALTRLAVSATLHCLTGCAIGEVLGLVLATWWGLANAPSILLAVVLAFVFGYSLTIAPVLRSGPPAMPSCRAAGAASCCGRTAAPGCCSRRPAVWSP